MAFFRFSRDKRGNENFYLVQPTVRRGKSRTRILYWFHSPPNVRVGRQPFDEATRRALEAQNPDVAFDWKTIIETPIPSGETEKWRERRRAERAQKQAAREDEANEAAPAEAEAGAESDTEPVAEQESEEVPECDASALDATASPLPVASVPVVPAGSSAENAAASSPQSQQPPSAGDPRRRKRRRRRGRRSGEPPHGVQSPDPATAAAPPEPAAPPETVGD